MHGLLDFLFPAQCGGCDRIGTGFCDACAAQSGPQESRIGEIAVNGLGLYAGAMQRAVLALKDGRRDVAEGLGSRLAALVQAGDVLVPVPTTFVRRLQRGFDGAEVLVKHAATNRATVCCALKKAVGDTQRGRNRQERLVAAGRFRVDAKTLAQRAIVLVDDVLTTGATLADCAATIAAAGGLVKRAIVLAVNR